MTKKKLDEIYSHVCPKCGGFHATASGFPDFGIDDEIKKLIDSYYNGYNGTTTAKNLANKVATIISIAVTDGYSQKVFDVDWESPDWEQIQNLQKNVYQFSFAKCYQQLKATTQSLYDKDGRIIPFKEFKEIATRINGEFNVRHLPTEYNFAIASAQSASRWVNFQLEKDVLPNLTFRTVGDDNVRDSHKTLEGTTRPVDDPIWDEISTPLGWGCRCYEEQSTGEEVTPISKVIKPTDTPAMFRTNIGKTGVLFPKEHAYYDDLPENVLKAADNNNPYVYEKLHKGKKGGYVYNNALHPKSNDWESEHHISKVLADQGDKVILLPEINPQGDNKALNKWKNELRKLVMPKGTKEGKNADAFINSKLVEFKTSQKNTYSSIQDLLKEGSKQADIICLKLTGKLNSKDLKRAIKGRVLKSDNITDVWVIDVNDKLTKYTRAEITEFFKSKKQK